MIWWIDAGAGASGDMLLGALLALDAEGLAHAQAAVDVVLGNLGETASVRLDTNPTRRAGLAAHQAVVAVDESTAPRTWLDIAPAPQGHQAARAVFESLAEAEAAVHGTAVEDVHFHEVGALDAIADIVAVTTLWERLAPEQVVVSAVCVGSGAVPTAHGSLPVPAPAVVELLRGVPTFAGPVAHEACTPTGAALLRFLADDWGPQPAMVVQEVGVGAGGRDTAGRPNVLRVLTGQPTGSEASDLVLVETTVDDLDPRIHPEVLAGMRTAGALEAWLTPVIMKHGRPAVVITALTPPQAVSDVTEWLVRQTTTLGVRRSPVDRVALARDVVSVTVAGHSVGVKRGWWASEIVTWQPEYADALEVARATGIPVREVIDRARETARTGSEKKRVRTPPTGETATSEQFKR